MASFDFSAYTETVLVHYIPGSRQIQDSLKINAIGPNASPRIKEAFPIMIRKIHEFLIEADVTVEEWMAACNLMVQAGKVSSEQRNEVVLVTDVFGIESLVDTLDQTRPQRKAKEASSHGPTSEATLSAILGPFYRAGVPVQPNGTSIIRQLEEGAPYTHLFGYIHGHDGKPLKGALVDIWHDAPDGLYDAQSPEKPEYHCRGRFQTDENGYYDTICLKPTPYPIPYDHQAGQLLTMMDRHPFRPAHIHYLIEAKGHTSLVTQVFDDQSKYLDDDSVFAVKDKLIVKFSPISKTYQAPADLKDRMVYELQQDFHLQQSTKPGDVVVEGTSAGISIVQNGANGH